jgi:S1-C subfamily serine protease
VIVIGLLALAVVLGGCASLTDTVSRLSAKGDFAGALAALEKAGVGTAVTEKASPGDIEARALYQSAVERKTTTSVEAAAVAGRAREAVSAAEDGLRLCPWSNELEALARERQDILGRIDALASQWAFSSSERREIAHVRSFLERAAPLYQQMTDSPAALAAVTQARSAIVDFWAAHAVSTLRRGNEADLNAFDTDLAALGLSVPSRAALATDFARLHALSWSSDTTRHVTQEQIALIREAAPLASDAADLSADQGSGKLRQALGSAFVEWRDSHLSRILADAPPTADLIEVAEECLKEAADGGAEFRRALAAAHLRYGDHHAAAGRVAVLALLHGARARDLDPEVIARAEFLERAAGASITSAAPWEATIAVDLAPDVSPAIHDLVELVIIGTIRNRTRSGFSWRWVDPIDGAAQVRVRLNEAQVLVGSQADLKLRESRYLSHYEDVPNPEKERLGRAVDLARLNMTTAEISYNSAVSSHNIYPTQWSLTAANAAYTRYSMAVDQYNLFVSAYNLAPATISQPVFLSYAFHEGEVAQGWVLRGSAELGDYETELDVESIERDFVRIGAKFGDVNIATRRDDALELDTSIDQLLSLLVTGADTLADQLVPLLSKLPTTRRANLSEAEQATVAWLLHPFSGTEQLGQESGVPRWALAVGQAISIPTTRIEPPETVVPDPPALDLGNSPTPSQIATALGPYTCQVVAGSASGSGALVSGNGIVLTCAHVLVGPAIRVSFTDGPVKGDYDAEVVFVNEAADVALLRADGLRAENWLRIRLDAPCERGETIVAFGNPAMPGITGASDTVTAGMVANPEAPAFGSRRLVADIAIASGSSGGPLVSVRTGEIVGVVQLIVAPGVSDFGGTSSSGYFAVAAPAHLLSELTGLKREHATGDSP